MEHVTQTEDLQSKINELKEILEQEKKFTRDVFESAPVAIIGVSRDNHIQMANRKAEQILTKPREELLGMLLSDAIPGANPFSTRRGDAKELKINLPWNGCALTWKSSLVRDDNGEVIGAMIFGSVFESLSGSTVWTERMNTIQSFVGGVAHDFNNLLSGVVGYSSLIKSMAKPEDRIFKCVEALDQSVKRITGLIQELLRFGRGGKVQAMPLNISSHVKELCNTWCPENNAISIKKDLAVDLRCVNADWPLIEEALRNLLENAAESMPEGGEISVSTEQVETVRQSANVINYPEPGTYVRIRIKDTGDGMDMGTLAKAFVPFFSTRAKAKGAGMGIPVAYAMVKRHNGYVTLESEPGKGTIASVYLPIQPIIENIDIDDASVAGGTETILIVDDEKEVTSSVFEMLKELGYSVLTANSGRQALKIYKEKRPEIDLVILDMMMPEMSGLQTYESLKNIDPELNVLLTSGVEQQMLNAGKISEKCGDSFVPKPYRLDKLSRIIRENIERGRPPSHADQHHPGS